ncbi:MAG: RNA polymerase sigma factor RpoD/SigA [Turicibacter sp.]|nr:RNA polymerase sigma factor RpoD/SigA [Turicibacter sp.]
MNPYQKGDMKMSDAINKGVDLEVEEIKPKRSQVSGSAYNLLMRKHANEYQYNLDYLKKYRLEKDESALEWLIFNNTNLVHKIVGRYTKFYQHKLDYDDLFSVGLEGLMKAIEKFDFNYDNNFSTYATYWVKQAVTRTIADEGFTIRIPVHMFESINQVMRYEQKVDQVSGPLDVENLCGELNIPKEKYETVKRVQTYMLKPTSLNGFVSREDEDTELQDLISNESDSLIQGASRLYDNPEKQAMDIDLKNYMDKMILNLNPREQFVITHRFGLNGVERKTLEELGEIEGVTRERIRQIEVKAMRKLRTLLVRYKEYLIY